MMILAIKPPEDIEDPLFGQIKDIYIIDDKVYFYVCVLDTLEYSDITVHLLPMFHQRILWFHTHNLHHIFL